MQLHGNPTCLKVSRATLCMLAVSKLSLMSALYIIMAYKANNRTIFGYKFAGVIYEKLLC